MVANFIYNDYIPQSNASINNSALIIIHQTHDIFHAFLPSQFLQLEWKLVNNYTALYIYSKEVLQKNQETINAI